MAWNRRYSLMSYVRSSLWVVPILALVLGVGIKRLSEKFDDWMVRQGFYDLRTSFLGVNADEAHALLDRIFNLNLSCLVFAFGSLLVAIQVAGGQYTPRIIATTLLRDNVIRGTVGLFVFTMLWVYRTMVELGQGTDVPQFQVFLASIFGMASLIVFIVLIDYAAKFLRPVSLVKCVGEQGMAVIEHVYPLPTQGVSEQQISVRKRKWRHLPGALHRPVTIDSASNTTSDLPDRVIYYKGKSAIVLAVNLQGLVAEAQRAGCVIELATQVGDFLGVEEPLFYLYGNAGAINERRLSELVALGSERTMEQDPIFAFRIEVDIALKALSPAINDPTTAVLAIDQLQHLLRMVGRRSLRNHEITDETGRLRVILRTPNWGDFVHISCREIRHYGAGSLQIERRLRAMIENLIRTLPRHRHPELRLELELLDRVIAQAHAFEEDITLARIPDSQGLGGAAGIMEPEAIHRE